MPFGSKVLVLKSAQFLNPNHYFCKHGTNCTKIYTMWTTPNFCLCLVLRSTRELKGPQGLQWQWLKKYSGYTKSGLLPQFCENSFEEHLSFAKVKICGAEVWSSEVEVKLMEGHGGEVHSLTSPQRLPRLWPYLEMWLLAHLPHSLPGVSVGRFALHNHNTITAVLLKAM